MSNRYVIDRSNNSPNKERPILKGADQKLIPLKRRYNRNALFKEVPGWKKPMSCDQFDLDLKVAKPFTVSNRFEMNVQPKHLYSCFLPLIESIPNPSKGDNRQLRQLSVQNFNLSLDNYKHHLFPDIKKHAVSNSDDFKPMLLYTDDNSQVKNYWEYYFDTNPFKLEHHQSSVESFNWYKKLNQEERYDNFPASGETQQDFVQVNAFNPDTNEVNLPSISTKPPENDKTNLINNGNTKSAKVKKHILSTDNPKLVSEFKSHKHSESDGHYLAANKQPTSSARNLSEIEEFTNEKSDSTYKNLNLNEECFSTQKQSNESHDPLVHRNSNKINSWKTLFKRNRDSITSNLALKLEKQDNSNSDVKKISYKTTNSLDSEDDSLIPTYYKTENHNALDLKGTFSLQNQETNKNQSDLSGKVSAMSSFEPKSILRNFISSERATETPKDTKQTIFKKSKPISNTYREYNNPRKLNNKDNQQQKSKTPRIPTRSANPNVPSKKKSSLKMKLGTRKKNLRQKKGLSFSREEETYEEIIMKFPNLNLIELYLIKVLGKSVRQNYSYKKQVSPAMQDTRTPSDQVTPLFKKLLQRKMNREEEQMKDEPPTEEVKLKSEISILKALIQSVLAKSKPNEDEHQNQDEEHKKEAENAVKTTKPKKVTILLDSDTPEKNNTMNDRKHKHSKTLPPNQVNDKEFNRTNKQRTKTSKGSVALTERPHLRLKTHQVRKMTRKNFKSYTNLVKRPGKFNHYVKKETALGEEEHTDPMTAFVHNFSKKLWRIIALVLVKGKIEKKAISNKKIPKVYNYLVKNNIIKGKVKEEILPKKKSMRENVFHKSSLHSRASLKSDKRFPLKSSISVSKKCKKTKFVSEDSASSEEDVGELHSNSMEKYNHLRMSIMYEMKHFDYFNEIFKTLYEGQETESNGKNSSSSDNSESELDVEQIDVPSELAEMFKDINMSFNKSWFAHLKEIKLEKQIDIVNGDDQLDIASLVDTDNFESFKNKRRFLEFANFISRHEELLHDQEGTLYVKDKHEMHPEELKAFKKIQFDKQIGKEKTTGFRKIFPVTTVGGRPIYTFSNLEKKYIRQRVTKANAKKHLDLKDIYRPLKKKGRAKEPFISARTIRSAIQELYSINLN